MKEEKLEQLRIVFKRMIKNYMNAYKDDEDYREYFRTEDDDIKTLANNLVYEVKIRIPNK